MVLHPSKESQVSAKFDCFLLITILNLLPKKPTLNQKREEDVLKPLKHLKQQKKTKLKS